MYPPVRDVGLSDHSCVLWSLDISRVPPVYRLIECRNWKSFDLDAFKGDLVCSTLYCDVIVASDTDTTLTSRYDTVLTELINKHAAARSILLRERQSNVWFDEECRAEKVRVRALERRFRSTDDPDDRATWTLDNQSKNTTHHVRCEKGCGHYAADHGRERGSEKTMAVAQCHVGHG